MRPQNGIAPLLDVATGGKDGIEYFSGVIADESNAEELVTEWRHHAMPQIRERFEAKEVDHTREAKAEAEFSRWRSDASIRARLIGGKSLLARVRRRVRNDRNLRIPSNGIFEQLTQLPEGFREIAQAIFPSIEL
ncbi:MAG: hypothetical protein ACKV0T_13485 [Planctomycetales bacterium]